MIDGREVLELRGLVAPEEQRAIVAELPPLRVPCSGDGERIDLGGSVLERAEAAARRAFERAAKLRSSEVLARLAGSALAVQAVIYGPNGAMAQHLDASVGRQPKHLVILSLGATCTFSADGRAFDVASGTALVFDAAAVMHGVLRIAPGPSPLRDLLPPSARVSLMFWQDTPRPVVNVDAAPLPDTSLLFRDDEDENEEL
mmetsp:Transcript_14143/g.42777  ORF Transcript_14143/g.42777 Transcript_14143/m.42777 type:complete len:201 (-) Transcript_14143:46-648(-)